MDEVVRIEPIQHEPGLDRVLVPILLLRDQCANPSPLNHLADTFWGTAFSLTKQQSRWAVPTALL
jgi:hypothetical protein